MAIDRRTARRGSLAFSAVGLLALLVGPTFATTAGAVRPSAAPSVSRVADLAPGAVPAGADAVGAEPGSQPVHLDIVLAPGDPAGVTTLLRALYDPSSPAYHRWLAPGAFAARFGPSGVAEAAAERWVRSLGARTVEARGFDVRAVLSAAQVSAGLGTPLERYRLRSGAVGYRPLGAPLLPADLAHGTVRAIVGLDTLASLAPAGATARPQASPDTPSSPRAARIDGLTACPGAQVEAQPGYYTLNQLGQDYGIDSLLAAGEDGAGETVGLFELAPHSAADVDGYANCFGLSNPVATATVDGGGTVDADGTAEADIDVEQVETQAPGASVISYEGPNTESGSYDTWQTIVDADQAQVVSTSWGLCEPDAASSGEIPAYSTLFQQAAAQGQTVLVASGDSGSEGCYAADGTTAEEVDYPASDPSVTAVGGTSLWAPGDETVWNGCEGTESTGCADSAGGQAAGGGGLSRYEPPLAGQPAVLHWGVDQACGEYCREVPDISANAGIGMVVDVAGQWVAYGGTSLAAPMLAGLVADKNDGCTTTTGLWTDDLYALAAQDVYGTALTDITAGDNDMTGSNGGNFPATTGYDGASGLGSPIAGGLSCPEITGVAPAAGATGTEVTVTGIGPDETTILFGSSPATIVGRTASTTTVTVPAGSGIETVSARNANGTGTRTEPFVYAAPAPAPVPPEADLRVVVSGATVAADLARFTEKVTVSNAGPAPAAAVLTTLTVPTGVTVIDAAGARKTGPKRAWTIVALGSGSARTYTVTFRVDAGARKTVTVAASTSSATRDPVAGNDTSKHRVRLVR